MPDLEAELHSVEARLEAIKEKATEVLGTIEKAVDWMEKFSNTLGSAPRDLVHTAEATAQVLIHLGSISRHSHDS
jgi:uncharacterized protein (DUF2384 family)